jgi:hypothetical protein
MAAKQVSGHDFSVLPDASAASKGSAVVPKTSQTDFFLAPQARAQRSAPVKD